MLINFAVVPSMTLYILCHGLIECHEENHMVPYDSMNENGMKLLYGTVYFHVWSWIESYVALDPGTNAARNYLACFS